MTEKESDQDSWSAAAAAAASEIGSNLTPDQKYPVQVELACGVWAFAAVASVLDLAAAAAASAAAAAAVVCDGAVAARAQRHYHLQLIQPNTLLS